MKLLGTLLTFLLGAIFFLSACDGLTRFSYENYSCQPKKSNLYEISIGKLKKGAMASLQFASKEVQAEITNLTENEIIMQFEGARLIANRQTGSTKIFIGNTYEKVSCIVDKFKM